MKNLVALIVLAYAVRLLIFPSKCHEKNKSPRLEGPSLQPALEPVIKQGISPNLSFFILCIIIILSCVTSVFILWAGGDLAWLNYWSYWFPCLAAIVFGLGAAFRPEQIKGDTYLQKLLSKITDKTFFEMSALFLFLGLLAHIYTGPCGWPVGNGLGISSVLLAGIVITCLSLRKEKRTQKIHVIAAILAGGLSVGVAYFSIAEIIYLKEKNEINKCKEYKNGQILYRRT